MGGKKSKKHRKSRLDKNPRHRERVPPLRVTRATSPTADISRDELQELAKMIREESRSELSASLARLLSSITRYEPLTLLSYLSFNHLMSPDGIESLDRGLPISQFHIELLQALVLQHEIDDFPTVPTFPDLNDFLADLNLAAMMFMLYRRELKDSEQESALLDVQEAVRSATQAMRNWGYPDQIERTVDGLFSPMDERVEAVIGVTPTKLFAMFLQIIAKSEERSRELINLLGPVLKAKSPEKAFDAFGLAFPNPTEAIGAAKSLTETYFSGSTALEIKHLLTHVMCLRLVSAHTFSVDDLLAMYDGVVDGESLVAVIDVMSLQFGDLAARNPEHHFLANPVWTKPFIRLGKQYFLPIPGMLLSFGLEMLESLVMNEPTLRDPYLKRRSDFLEDAIAEVFGQAFPGAQISKGSMWPQKGKNENDLTVVVDRVAIVIEAKAGGVSDSRMGGDKSLKSDIGELMVKASRQSSDFVAFLRSSPGRFQFESKRGAANVIDTTHIKEFIRLNVTLHSLGPIYSHWPQLQAAGFIPADVQMAPTMTLADLESVFDVLEGECMKLHYLARRTEIEQHANYVGGELDLLALYLETGFNIDSLEFDGSTLWLAGDFTRLQGYFMRHATKKRIPRPRPALSRWWSELLRWTERVKPFGWSRLGMALLTVPYEDQERLERHFGATKVIVKNHWKNKRHVELNYLDTGPIQRLLAVGAFAYRGTALVDHRSKLHDVIAQIFDGVKADRLLFIGVNVQKDNPWDDLILAPRPQESPGESS